MSCGDWNYFFVWPGRSDDGVPSLIWALSRNGAAIEYVKMLGKRIELEDSTEVTVSTATPFGKSEQVVVKRVMEPRYEVCDG